MKKFIKFLLTTLKELGIPVLGIIFVLAVLSLWFLFATDFVDDSLKTISLWNNPEKSFGFGFWFHCIMFTLLVSIMLLAGLLFGLDGLRRGVIEIFRVIRENFILFIIEMRNQKGLHRA
jgi:ABC-type transport system involved in cytochrome c biogenesis permease component